MGKFLPWIVAGVVVIVSGGGAFWLVQGQRAQMQQISAELNQRKGEIETYQGQVQAVTQKLQEVQTERASFEKKVAVLQGQFDSTSAELERTRADRDKAEDRYKRLTEKQQELESELTYLKAERDAARQAADKAKAAQGELERQVVRLRSRMNLLDRDYKELQGRFQTLQQSPRPGLMVMADSTWGPTQAPAVIADSSAEPQAAEAVKAESASPAAIELLPVRVSREQEGGKSQLTGHVVEVNAALNFLLLNRGSEDGIQEGMVFTVMRDTVAVGRVRATRVRQGMSACDLLTPSDYQVGDVALLTG